MYRMLMACIVVILFCSTCDNPFANEEEESAQVSVFMHDLTGKVGACNFRIIERNPACKSNCAPVNIQTHSIDHPNVRSYTFTDVEAGEHAMLVGNIGDTYLEFTATAGEAVKIHYEYSASSTVTIGEFSSGGSVTLPYNTWKGWIE